MRIFYELRYAVIIEIAWTFYLKSVPAKFQKYLKHISWVISGTSSSKLPCNPLHPSWNISCNHRHHLLQPSWRRICSISNNQKTMVAPPPPPPPHTYTQTNKQTHTHTHCPHMWNNTNTFIYSHTPHNVVVGRLLVSPCTSVCPSVCSSICS